jgi:methionyl aminopeptidase
VLKVDVGVWFEGWVGDAAWTYVFGEPSAQVKRLTECGKEALARGVKELQPGRPYLNWARAVQGYVEGETPQGAGST